MKIKVLDARQVNGCIEVLIIGTAKRIFLKYAKQVKNGQIITLGKVA